MKREREREREREVYIYNIIPCPNGKKTVWKNVRFKLSRGRGRWNSITLLNINF